MDYIKILVVYSVLLTNTDASLLYLYIISVCRHTPVVKLSGSEPKTLSKFAARMAADLHDTNTLTNFYGIWCFSKISVVMVLGKVNQIL